MADHQDNEKWFEGKSSLFKSRAERVKADIARRKAGRKAIKGKCPTCGTVMFKILGGKATPVPAPEPAKPSTP